MGRIRHWNVIKECDQEWASYVGMPEITSYQWNRPLWTGVSPAHLTRALYQWNRPLWTEASPAHLTRASYQWTGHSATLGFHQHTSPELGTEVNHMDLKWNGQVHCSTGLWEIKTKRPEWRRVWSLISEPKGNQGKSQDEIDFTHTLSKKWCNFKTEQCQKTFRVANWFHILGSMITPHG